MTYTQTAQDIFRTAYENRYTWDESFPGYEAELTLTQGDEVYTAQVTVNPDLSTDVTGIEEATVKESISYQLKDIVTHRQRASFEKVHGQNQFSFGKKGDEEAIEIQVSGKSMGSRYKVKGAEICHVYRVMGPMAFSIDTTGSFETGEGYVPTEYTAIFQDSATGTVKGDRNYQEKYEKVGNYYLPAYQKIEETNEKGETLTTIFQFSNFRLLAQGQ